MGAPRVWQRRYELRMVREPSLYGFHRTGSVTLHDRMAVDVGVFHDQEAARGHERRVGVQLGQHMVVVVVGIKNDEALLALRPPGDVKVWTHRIGEQVLQLRMLRPWNLRQ